MFKYGMISIVGRNYVLVTLRDQRVKKVLERTFLDCSLVRGFQVVLKTLDRCTRPLQLRGFTSACFLPCCAWKKYCYV